MSYLNTKQRYGSLSIALHWVMLLLFIGVYACIECADFYPDKSDMHRQLMRLHFSFGLSIFLLVCLRLVARFMGQTPEIVPAIPAWQKWLSTLVHIALYLFMIAMPVAGYTGRMLAGRETSLFGIPLPIFLNVNKDLAENIFDLHSLIGNVFYYVIALHAAAALFHHYLKRDNTLTRMLPKRG